MTVEIKLHVRRTVVFLLEKPINAHFQYDISVAQAKVCISHSVHSRAQFHAICSFLQPTDTNKFFFVAFFCEAMIS